MAKQYGDYLCSVEMNCDGVLILNLRVFYIVGVGGGGGINYHKCPLILFKYNV